MADVPVLLFNTSNKMTKESSESMLLEGQDFDTHNWHKDFAHNVIPLNYENRDEILKQYGRTKLEASMEKAGFRKTMQFSIRNNPDLQNMTEKQMMDYLETKNLYGENRSHFTGHNEWANNYLSTADTAAMMQGLRRPDSALPHSRNGEKILATSNKLVYATGNQSNFTIHGVVYFGYAT